MKCINCNTKLILIEEKVYRCPVCAAIYPLGSELVEYSELRDNQLIV